MKIVGLTWSVVAIIQNYQHNKTCLESQIQLFYNIHRSISLYTIRSRVRHLLDGMSCKTNEYHLPRFYIQSFYLLLGRLPSNADEFYLPNAKATGLKAPDIRL